MKPTIPPHLIAGLCGLTIKEQATRAGISRRHLLRLLRLDWSHWRVSTAEAWCIGCGVDFWSLSLQPLARNRQWNPESRADALLLSDMIRLSGARPTKEAVQRLARALNHVGT